MLALYNHSEHWNLRVILSGPPGSRPYVARGIYLRVLYEPTDTAGHDVYLPEGVALQATPLGQASSHGTAKDSAFPCTLSLALTVKEGPSRTPGTPAGAKTETTAPM